MSSDTNVEQVFSLTRDSSVRHGSRLQDCTPQASRPPAESPDNSPIIVEINGAPEHLAAFERFVKARLSDFYPQSLENQGDKDKLRSGLFDAFVLRQLVVHEARSKGMNASEDEVGRVIEEQRQQTRTEGSEPSPATLASTERRAEIANDLLTLKYYRTEVIKGVVVTPEEIENVLSAEFGQIPAGKWFLCARDKSRYRG